MPILATTWWVFSVMSETPRFRQFRIDYAAPRPPAKTLYILLADLHDTSPNEKRFVSKMEFLLASGIKAVTLPAISDHGQPSYNADLAGRLAKLGMPCFGCVPDRLPDLLAAVLKGADLRQFAESVRIK